LLALQAHANGLYTHGMTGIDFAAAREALNVPERFRIEAAIAIGRMGDAATLPEPLRARETPSLRRPIGDSAAAGPFPDNW
jgi:nitroreductase